MTRQIRALIVDDSYTTRRMVMNALSQTGLAEFLFVEADDGLDALEKYQHGKTQILFVDMNMPRMDGLAFIRELHARHENCPPSVIITAESSKEKLMEALSQTGVDAFLLKPVDRDRLYAGLKTLIGGIPEPSAPCVVPHGECVPQALREVLAQACDLELSSVPVDEEIRRGDVVFGMISILGDVQWSVVLGFTRDAASSVASRFAGCDGPIDDDDMGDAIGEITNILGSRVKLLLGKAGLVVEMSLPMVISASDFRFLIQRRRKGADAYAHFDSPVGELWTKVTVGLHPGMVL